MSRSFADVARKLSGPAVHFLGGDVVSAFALMAIGLVVAMFVVLEAVSLHAFHRADARSVTDAAPITMNLARRLVEEEMKESRDYQAVGATLLRMPSVAWCEIKIDPTDADEATRTPFDHTFGARPEQAELLELSAALTGPGHAGTLRIAFSPPSAWGMRGLLWTSYGVVTIVALLVLLWTYRVLSKRIRPLGLVCDSLLAYHSGDEQTIETLQVPATASEITGAWNELVEEVTKIHRELDEFRCREVITTRPDVCGTPFKDVLEALPVGLVRVDHAGHLTYSNPAAQRFLGIEPVSGRQPLDAVLENKAVVQCFGDLRNHVNDTGIDVQAGGPDDTVVRLTPVVTGSVAQDLTVMVQDVSQLKQAERSRDEFLAHITHELRTPLTNIRAYTETLTEDFFDDEQTRRECYNVIMGETRRLSRLIEDVLSVSQIEAGAARLARTATRVDEMLRQVIQDMQANADKKAIDLVLKIPSKVPLVSGDRHRLIQVWTNLIGNAIKYTPQNGTVRVDLETEDNILKVRVSDTGIGISEEYHQRIFDKFFRVDTGEEESEEGTGLGLSISREIIRMHGGNIRVESQSGSGSTFTTELPVLRAAEAKAGVDS